MTKIKVITNEGDDKPTNEYSRLLLKLKRMKFQPLEKMFIVKLHLELKMSCSKIFQYFFLPYSSVNRIIKANDADGVASFGKLDKEIIIIDTESIIHKLMQDY